MLPKPVLATLATAALLVTVEAAFMEFTENNVKKLYPPDETKSKLDASINFVGSWYVNFGKAAGKSTDGTVAHLHQNAKRGHEYDAFTNNHFTINIGGHEIKAMAEFFDIKVDRHDGNMQSVRIFFTFFSEGKNGYVFEVPILQKPRQVKSYDMNELRDWAENEGHVGVNVPVSLATLMYFTEKTHKNRLRVNIFSCLTSVLPHKITEREIPPFMKNPRFNMHGYATRPLVVDKMYMKALVDYIDSYYEQYNPLNYIG